ncbi:MAG: methylated-DNA--[protein]-cysteine S-methyltransferase [Bacteroidia bacterium]
MDSNIKIQFFKTNFGELILGDYQGKLCLCDWRYRSKRKQIDARVQQTLQADFIEESSALHEHVILELQAYFRGERQQFTIPIMMLGSEFQQTVWSALTKIPYGKTISYAALSQRIGDEKAVRAVAAANGANALAIIIPCHRVIASNGDLQGYAGGINTKKKLLDLEGAIHQTYLSF